MGEAGQNQLRKASAFICGCGALGSLQACWLARAGIGRLILADPDYVALHNLQRQILFSESDTLEFAHDRKPVLKVEAASVALHAANHEVNVEVHPVRVTHDNVHLFTSGVDLILDATDNYPTRFILNRESLRLGIPWIYGGVLGAAGQVMAFIPGKTPCLECIIPNEPDFTSLTCDECGILGPAVGVIASFQAMLAMKILSGNTHLVRPVMHVFSLWDDSYKSLNARNLCTDRTCNVCHKNHAR